MVHINEALNNALNRSADLSKPVNPETGDIQGRVATFCKPRCNNLVDVLPKEVVLFGKNVLKGAIYVPGVVLKPIAKAATRICKNETLKKFHNKMPTLTDLLKTVARIIQLFVGAASTFFLGIIFHPEANFKAHLALNLATDLRAEEEKSKALEEQFRKEQVTQAAQETVVKKGDKVVKPAESALQETVRANEDVHASAANAIIAEIQATKTPEPEKAPVAEAPTGFVLVSGSVEVPVATAQPTVTVDAEESVEAEATDEAEETEDTAETTESEASDDTRAEIQPEPVAAKSKLARVGDAVSEAFSSAGTKTANFVYGAGSLTKKTVYGAGSLTKKTVYGAGSLTKKTVYGAGSLTKKTAFGAASLGKKGVLVVAHGVAYVGNGILSAPSNIYHGAANLLKKKEVAIPKKEEIAGA